MAEVHPLLAVAHAMLTHGHAAQPQRAPAPPPPPKPGSVEHVRAQMMLQAARRDAEEHAQHQRKLNGWQGHWGPKIARGRR